MTNFDEKWLMQAIEAVSSGFTKKIARDNILVYRIDQVKPLIRIDIKLDNKKETHKWYARYVVPKATL